MKIGFLRRLYQYYRHARSPYIYVENKLFPKMLKSIVHLPIHELTLLQSRTQILWREVKTKQTSNNSPTILFVCLLRSRIGSTHPIPSSPKKIASNGIETCNAGVAPPNEDITAIPLVALSRFLLFSVSTGEKHGVEVGQVFYIFSAVPTRCFWLIFFVSFCETNVAKAGLEFVK